MRRLLPADIRYVPCDIRASAAMGVFRIEKIVQKTLEGDYEVEWAPSWVLSFRAQDVKVIIETETRDSELWHLVQWNNSIEKEKDLPRDLLKRFNRGSGIVSSAVITSKRKRSSSRAAPGDGENVLIRKEKKQKPKDGQKGLFEVEQIRGLRPGKKCREFFVKWKGYDSEENTWEPEYNLTECQELISQYFEAH